MKRRVQPPAFFLFSVFLIILSIQNRAQGNSHVSPDNDSLRTGPVIGLILIQGNRYTDEEIIRRELTLGIGDRITDKEIEYCRNRVYSLGLFNKVEIEFPPMDTTVMMVTVDERWFLYPVPMLGIVHHDFSKWYYGLGVKHENLSGGNEKLFAGFVLGYNPWVKIDFSDPWIFGRSQMFAQTVLSYANVENRSAVARGDGPNFYESHYSVSQTFGKRYDPYRRTWATAGFSYVEITEKGIGRTLSEEGIDRFLFAGIGASHDTRDLFEYPTEGVYGAASLTRFGFGESVVDYTAAAVDVRTYAKIVRGVSLALRGFTVVTFGPAVPVYHHHFFGFGERLRGHFSEEMEGENIFGTSAELRIPIVESVYLHVPQVPVRQFATWRFGLYVSLFMDAGNVWNRGDALSWNGMPMGYGAGIHILLPYSLVVRFEQAWNELGEGEFILDLGTSF